MCVAVARSKVRSLSAFTVVLGGLGLAASPSFGLYSLTDLGTLGGAQSAGGGINKSGQATGWADTTNGTQDAFFYSSNAGMIDLGPFMPTGTTGSEGAAINDSGLIAGTFYSLSGSVTIPQAFLYNPGSSGTVTVLPELCALSGASSSGAGINDMGQVTGWAASAPTAGSLAGFCGNNHAFVYSPGSPPTIQDLGVYCASSVQADCVANQSGGQAINQAGYVAGWSGSFGSNTAFSYDPGTATMTPLPAPIFSTGSAPSPNSRGYGINGAQQITGWVSWLAGLGAQSAFIYNPGSPGVTTLIGPTTGLGGNSGYDINTNAHVVGTMNVQMGMPVTMHAFLYTNNTTTDLNALVDPTGPLAPYVTLTKGDAINDSDEILADGVDSRTGQTHAYLLTGELPPPYCETHADSTFCKLLPVLLCNIQCFFNFKIYWATPVWTYIDPWLDGVIFTIQVPTAEETRSLATGLQVTVNSETLALSVAERTITADIFDDGTLRSLRVLVAGPNLEVSVAPSASSNVQRIMSTGADRGAELVLPYVATGRVDGEKFRMVELDKSTGRWSDIENQRVDSAKHVVSARVSTAGRFTVVEVPVR